MKLALAILAVGLLAGPAAAILDDGTNSLGVYFDQSGELDCFSPAAFTPFTMYFIVAHPIDSVLGGFEFDWRFSPPITPPPIFISTTLPPGGVNLAKEGGFRVTLEQGLVTGEATVLASCVLFLLTYPPDQNWVTVGPTTPARIPHHACTLGFTDSGPTIMALRAFDDWGGIDGEGWADPGVAQFYCSHGDPVETATWGEVKSLYR